MRTVQFPDGITLCISSDMVAEMRRDYQEPNTGTPPSLTWIYEHAVALVRAQFRKVLTGKYAEYTSAYATKSGLRGMAILDAHGFTESGSWLYQDGRRGKPVQEWVNKHDGQFACLLMGCCNPGGHTVGSERSLLILADRIVQLAMLELSLYDPYIVTLVHPRRGEIDDYVIDYELNYLLSRRKRP